MSIDLLVPLHLCGLAATNSAFDVLRCQGGFGYMDHLVLCSQVHPEVHQELTRIALIDAPGSYINGPWPINSSYPSELEYYRNELTPDSYEAEYPPSQVLISFGSVVNAYHVIRYANNEAFDSEAVALPTSRSPNPVFSQLPSQLSSWHIPPDSGSILRTPTSRFANPEQQACTNTGVITSRGDRRYDREFFPSARGCDAHTLKHPLDPPSSPSQSFVTNPKPEDSDTIDTISHGTPTYPVFFTDDATMKLGDHIRRQCFNCRTMATKAWRRSVLSPGKLVCLG